MVPCKEETKALPLSFPCYCYQKGEAAGECVVHAVVVGAENPNTFKSFYHHFILTDADTSHKTHKADTVKQSSSGLKERKSNHACMCVFKDNQFYLTEVVVNIKASASQLQEFDQFADDGHLLMHHRYVESSVLNTKKQRILH